MLNFDIKRTTRKCAATERAFVPGEEFVSALFDEDGEMVRRDFSLEAWTEPPENCFGWWKCHIPKLDTDRVYWAPNDLLLSYFQKIQELPGQEPTAFVMALLLVQKKILRLQDHDDETQLNLLHRKSKSEYQVPILELTTEQKNEIQNELAAQLFTDRAPDQDQEGSESNE